MWSQQKTGRWSYWMKTALPATFSSSSRTEATTRGQLLQILSEYGVLKYFGEVAILSDSDCHFRLFNWNQNVCVAEPHLGLSLRSSPVIVWWDFETPVAAVIEKHWLSHIIHLVQLICWHKGHHDHLWVPRQCWVSLPFLSFLSSFSTKCQYGLYHLESPEVSHYEDGKGNILAREDSWFKSVIKEAVYVKLEWPSLNRGGRLWHQLSATYSAVLRALPRPDNFTPIHTWTTLPPSTYMTTRTVWTLIVPHPSRLKILHSPPVSGTDEASQMRRERS